MRRSSTYISSFVLVMAAAIGQSSPVAAQDTLIRKRTVEVTSTFKPVIKEAAKINFNATPPAADTSRPILQYQIPNQNLLFPYQPGSLKPLALQIDSATLWSNESFVKAGFGNLRTPFLQAGLSLGDGKTSGVNLYAKHTSSNGKIPYQTYSNTNFDAVAFLRTQNNLEWNGRIGAKREKYNKYGFLPDTLKFSDDSLDVKFNTWRGRISFHNIDQTPLGISYTPELTVDVFNDKLGNSESNTYINLPIQKQVGKVFAVDLGVAVSLTRYKPDGKESINNNYVSLSPSILFKTPNVKIQAGIKPSWDKKDFLLFPNAMAELNSTDNRFSFQLGWLGYLRNSGFQYVAGLNPYIWAPANIYNTRIEERYAGFKGSAGDHLNFSAKVGFNKINNQPLFVNDTFSGKSFEVVNESEMKVLHLGGEIGYTIGEKFSLISNLKINKYNNLKTNEKAFGLLPIDYKTSVRVQVMKDLYINSDLYLFQGAWYKSKNGSANRSGGGADFSAGVEFAVVKNVKLWAQFNNILNNQYQRWNQYPVYGFNLLGGVIFSFDQLK